MDNSYLRKQEVMNDDRNMARFKKVNSLISRRLKGGAGNKDKKLSVTDRMLLSNCNSTDCRTKLVVDAKQ